MKYRGIFSPTPEKQKSLFELKIYINKKIIGMSQLWRKKWLESCNTNHSQEYESTKIKCIDIIISRQISMQTLKLLLRSRQTWAYLYKNRGLLSFFLLCSLLASSFNFPKKLLIFLWITVSKHYQLNRVISEKTLRWLFLFCTPQCPRDSLVLVRHVWWLPHVHLTNT